MFKGIGCVLLAAVLWGTGGVMGQYLYTYHQVDAIWLVMVRQILAGLIFLGYSKLVLKDDVCKLLKVYPVSILFFSFPGILGAQLGFYYTISLCNAGTATVLQYTAPIFVLLWVAYQQRRWPDIRESIGVVLAFIGVFLISTHGRLDSIAISGLALVTGILSAFSYAIYSVQPVEMLKHFPTTTVIGWGQLISGLFLILFRDPLHPAGTWSLSAVAAFAHLVICATVLTYGLYLTGLKIIGSTKAALFSCAEPVSSVICVVLFLGTKLTTMDIIGMDCIIFTVAMLSLAKEK